MLWDIGCNTGDYAFLALEAGADRVIGLEADNRAVEYAFRRAVERNARFLPLRMNVLNPSPSSGWRQRERPGLDLRMRGADFILALALVHHLAFRGNVPLEDIVAWLVSLAPAGVIEFVPKQDPMVQVLLSSRSDNFASYTEEVFRRAVQANSRIVAEERLDGSGRLVVHYVRDP
jgi:ribosomal protein L11 methylase PrmA